MQDTRPAVDVATASDLGCSGWVETDGTGRNLMAEETHQFNAVPFHKEVWVCGVYGVVSSVCNHKLTVCLKELLLVVRVQLISSSCHWAVSSTSATATVRLSWGECEVEQVVQRHLLPAFSPDRVTLRRQ